MKQTTALKHIVGFAAIVVFVSLGGCLGRDYEEWYATPVSYPSGTLPDSSDQFVRPQFGSFPGFGGTQSGGFVSYPRGFGTLSGGFGTGPRGFGTAPGGFGTFPRGFVGQGFKTFPRGFGTVPGGRFPAFPNNTFPRDPNYGSGGFSTQAR